MSLPLSTVTSMACGLTDPGGSPRKMLRIGSAWRRRGTWTAAPAEVVCESVGIV
jgi:hypothetical protein